MVRIPRFSMAALFMMLVTSSCVSTSYKIREVSFADDLDSCLREREAAVAGLIAGDEKQIIWAGEPGRKTPISIVYIHGWEGSRHEYDAVFDTVAQELSANLFYTRLRGYSVTSEEITRVRLDDWVNDTWEAYEIGRRIGERVIVAGSSMGGDLTLWLASQHPPGLGGVVLLSCAVQPQDRRSDMLLWPWPLGNIILRTVVGKYNIITLPTDIYPTGNAELMARYYPPRYRSESMIKLMTVVKLVRKLPVESIAVPSLWLYSERDNEVDIPSLKAYFARMGGEKRMVEVTGARAHMLAGAIFQPETTPEVIEAVLAFLRQYAPSPR
jgi:pimeloyl-ACP methyl ester carboxylesterase